MSRKPSALELALRYDLDLCINAHRVEVIWYDIALSETHEFTEDVDCRSERRAALGRCIERAIAKANSEKGRY